MYYHAAHVCLVPNLANFFLFRLESSYGRKNVRPAELIMKAYSHPKYFD